jgi:hypothetical protein
VGPPVFSGGSIRDFVDAILAFIATSSLTDDEFDTITIEDEAYSAELYAEVLAVLTAREAVSSTRDRLTAYFTARGATVTDPGPGTSNIFLGDELCS